jgi:hypothetical protein
MKKIIGILVVAGFLLAMMPMTALADSEIELDEDSAIDTKAGYKKSYKQKYNLLNGEQIERKKSDTSYESKSTIQTKRVVKVRGVWGIAGDNESDGFFGGRLIRRGRFIVFKGLYNKTDNETMGKVVGIMKKGYFNGVVITPGEYKCKITGLYDINKEDRTFKMKWLTPHNSGWARAKIVISE